MVQERRAAVDEERRPIRRGQIGRGHALAVQAAGAIAEEVHITYFTTRGRARTAYVRHTRPILCGFTPIVSDLPAVVSRGGVRGEPLAPAGELPGDLGRRGRT